nr:flocculation protein FLO11-like [Ipomoea batatas]
MISASDHQAMDGTCPSYLLQSAVYHCFQAIKGLAKDSKLLRSTKAAHFKEVKAVKADLTKLGASLATEQEGFYEWLEGEVEMQYLLDFGEADYGMGYQDAQMEIFELLKARDATFSPTRWGFLNPVTPDDNQGAEDVALNASIDTLGGKILMDNAYLESAANVGSVAGVDQAYILTLTEVGRSDAAATSEEEDPSDALQLNHHRFRSSEHDLRARQSEVDTGRVSQSKA